MDGQRPCRGSLIFPSSWCHKGMSPHGRRFTCQRHILLPVGAPIRGHHANRTAARTVANSKVDQTAYDAHVYFDWWSRLALCVRGIGSTLRPTLRTFVWAWFKLPQPASRRNSSGSIRQERRNPVALALDWQQRLDSGEFTTRAELARELGVTRAHVTQVLSLLHLVPEVRSFDSGPW